MGQCQKYNGKNLLHNISRPFQNTQPTYTAGWDLGYNSCGNLAHWWQPGSKEAVLDGKKCRNVILGCCNPNFEGPQSVCDVGFRLLMWKKFLQSFKSKTTNVVCANGLVAWRDWLGQTKIWRQCNPKLNIRGIIWILYLLMYSHHQYNDTQVKISNRCERQPSCCETSIYSFDWGF